ncbi:transglycosylase domain-containing protein [Nocardioides sp.]|uniref:transglycosylase domain-containing protein n=1 Tax=Nocardioides sp. TaxID=35761 RepID=UPI0039E675D9
MSRPRSDRLPASRVLPHLLVMLAVAAILGVVVAGLAVPLAGVAGLGARKVARSMDDLPEELKTGELPQRSKIVDADGKLITWIYADNQNRTNRALDQVSETMVQALLSIEDYRFYQHGALDLKGTVRALITNKANGGVVQGGSSITQQLVKQTLINEATTDEERKAATEETYQRKLQELRYAIALEQNHSKSWILERYLNIAYFGDGAYGVQVAAKHYFNTDASKLTLTQAALLAGLVKNPTGFDPTSSPDRALARRNVVLDRMAQLQVITDAEAEAAKAEPLGLSVKDNQNGCVSSKAAFFCDYVLRWLKQDPALGRTPDERENLLETGGLTIKTTLRMADQKAADTAVSDNVYATDNAIGGIAMVEPGTGDVLALAQSRPMGADAGKGETYLNYVVPQELGDSAGFQAGSTFKAFVLAQAIEDNVGLKTTLDARSPMTFDTSTFQNCPGEPGFVGDWPVSNSTRSGRMDVYTGTRQSVNTFYAQLEQITGVCAPYRLAKAMGIKLTNPTGDANGNGAERIPSFTLGVVNVSPLEMAEAYATFGARGLHCDNRPVTEIDDSAGNVVKTYDPSCQQVMQQTTADGVSDVLRGVQEPGGFGYTSGGTNLTNAAGETVPSAGKTGTTQDGMSVWFMGYTPQIATAAMIAGANSKGQPITLQNQLVAGSYHNVSGSGFAGPMWAEAMHAIDDGLNAEDFVAPTPEVVDGKTVRVPSVSGMSLSAAKARLRSAGFTPIVGPRVYSGVYVGGAAYTYPSSSAPPHSVITIYVSQGPEPKKSKGKKGGKGRGGRGGR